MQRTKSRNYNDHLTQHQRRNTITTSWEEAHPWEPEPAAEPTDAQPGTPEKFATLLARFDAGQDLWHEDDKTAFPSREEVARGWNGWERVPIQDNGFGHCKGTPKHVLVYEVIVNHHPEGLTSSQIGDELGITYSTASNCCTTLRRKGLIKSLRKTNGINYGRATLWGLNTRHT